MMIMVMVDGGEKGKRNHSAGGKVFVSPAEK
jgi:hypothetical protein